MIGSLRLMINPKVISNITIDRSLIIKEDGAKSKIKKLTINNMPEDALAFTLDYQPGKAENRYFKQLSCYLNVANGIGINQGCDVVILWSQGGGVSAVVCDLKSDKPDMVKAKSQLHNSRLFLEYLCAMAISYYGGIAVTDIKSRVVTSGVRKGAVYKNSFQDNDEFQMKHVVPSNNEARIYFQELVK